MATHDRYEQDILNALRGIDRSLKKIADTLVPKNEKRPSSKPNIYYRTRCPYCNHLFTLPIGWEEYKTNEQDN